MKIPKGQHLWVTINNPKKKETWAICSDEARLKYTLYRIEGEKLVKKMTAGSPAEFEDIVGVSI